MSGRAYRVLDICDGIMYVCDDVSYVLARGRPRRPNRSLRLYFHTDIGEPIDGVTDKLDRDNMRWVWNEGSFNLPPTGLEGVK